jgi:membrane protein implicated in regulation of membrane protease activity
MLQRIFISLGITSLVSVLVGLLVSKFWLGFALSFILQVVFFYLFNSVYENRLIERAQILKLEEVKELSKNKVILECPCAEKNKQEINMRFDENVVYECSKCKKNIKADAIVKNVLTTQPIYFNDRT